MAYIVRGGIVFFYGESSPFSNLHPARFMVEGKQFNCVEQFYMFKKAQTFGDCKRMDKIMQEEVPKRQKFLGKGPNIKNYQEDKWYAVARDIMKTGLRAKVSSNGLDFLKYCIFRF